MRSSRWSRTLVRLHTTTGGLWLAIGLLAGSLGCAHGSAVQIAPAGQGNELPSYSRQLAIREGWLQIRHGMLLDMMRRHGVGMWIVVTEEFHPDPLAEYVAPPRPYVGSRDFFVFVDAGEKGLRKVAIPSYAEESVARFFETPDEPRSIKEVLPELVRAHDPKTIALSIGGTRGQTRSLGHDTYELLAEILGGDTTRRVVSAEPLIEEYLDTRIPEEREVYMTLVRITEELARRALSNEVIAPGRTTAGELRAWLLDQTYARGAAVWFQPDVRLQRQATGARTSRGFLAVSEDDEVIQPGDLVHLDFGITALGLSTDWQKMAYVLRPGERDVPAGVERILANTNALQDAVCRLSRPGRPAGEVFKAVMAEMETRGIKAMVYSHALGNHGHGVGARIDFRAAKQEESGKPGKTLRAGSYFAIELNTSAPLPEWGGQEVTVMEEDPAWLDDAGWHFFLPRQERLYLIH
jgi:Xaa-Pro dipeptidase